VTAREIPVLATATIGHRAYHVRPCGDGFAAVSAEGQVTVLDSGLRVVRRFELGERVGDVTIAPDGTTWAWAADGRLWIGEPGGPAKDTPLPDEVSCRWLPSGQEVWVAAGTGDEVLVEIRDPDHDVRAAVTVPDPFGGSMVMLCAHPRDDAVVLWVAAGQDGQQSWLVTDDGTGLDVALLPADGGLPALFGPDGSWLLAADFAKLRRLSWPGGAELGTLSWADTDPEAAADGSDEPGADLVLLPGDHASWNTNNGRVRTVDLTTMTVVDEITLAGHPLRTVADLYPSLAGDENLCTDFGFSVLGAGGTVLSVHGKNTLVLSDLRDWSPA
jgi:hypothetical protein